MLQRFAATVFILLCAHSALVNANPSGGETLTLATDAIQPHMAISRHDVFVACIHKGNISITTSSDEGKSFDRPVVVMDVGGRARGGRHRGPRIGVDDQGRLTVTAPVTFDDNEYKKKYPTADLYFVQSSDRGKTWTRPKRINAIEKKAPESLHWMAVDQSGNAHVAWLDMRNRDRGQDIFFATISDGVVSPNTKVAATVCECCAPGLAVDAKGCLLAYREGGDAASREIFARYRNGSNAAFLKPMRVNSVNTLEDG
jgi:hypothetical protein